MIEAGKYRWVKVEDLQRGDHLDLAHDIHADPGGMRPAYRIELMVVERSEQEALDCIRVDLRQEDPVRFPTGHKVKRVTRKD